MRQTKCSVTVFGNRLVTEVRQELWTMFTDDIIIQRS